MVSTESTDMILDLLYGELTPEESERAQKLIAQNDDLQAEFNRLQATRAELQTALPDPQPVPTTVHDAIMAAAAAQIDSTHAQPPPPHALRPPKTTIWSRITNTPRAQFTAVATVAALLLTSAVLWRQITQETPHSNFQTASHEVRNELRFDNPSQIATTPAYEPAPPSAVALANEEAKPNEPYEFETAKIQEEEIEQEPAPVGEGARAPAMANTPSANNDALKKPTRSYSSRDIERSESSIPMAKKTRPRSAPAKRRSAKPRKRAMADSFDLFETDDPSSSDNAGGRSTGAPPQPRSAPTQKSAKTASPMDHEHAEQSAEVAATPLQNAEKALSNGDYSTAISQAEQAFKNTRTTPDTRARALQIQALAYTQQGNATRADAIYKTLQTQYPAYRSAEIKQARTALPSPKDKQPQPANSDQTRPSSID